MTVDRATLFDRTLVSTMKMLSATQRTIPPPSDAAVAGGTGPLVLDEEPAPILDTQRSGVDQPRLATVRTMRGHEELRLRDETTSRPLSGYNLLMGYCVPQYEDVRGNSGPKGERRLPISEEAGPGKKGTDGAALITRAEMPDLVGAGSLTYFSSLLRAAEYDYLRDNRESSLEKLTWVLALVSAFVEVSDDDFEVDQFQAKEIASSLRDRAGILMRQIDTGMNYFGEPEAFVPRLSVDFYKDRISRLFLVGSNIEDAHRRYFAYEADQAYALAAFRDTIDTTQARRRSLEIELLDADDDFDAAQSRIDYLREELDSLWLEIFSAEDNFKKAVAARSGCDFGATVMFVGAVVTAVSTGSAAVPAVITAVKALGTPTTKDGEPIEGTIDYFDFVARTLKPAGKSLSEFGKAYDEVKDLLKGEEPQDLPNLPDDKAKFIVAKKDFDDALRPFLKMPEAQDYKRLADNFVALAETRNNLIFEADMIHASRRGLEAAIREIDTSIQAIRADLAGSIDPRASSYAEFMERANMDSKRLLAEEIYRFARAYSFFALRSPPGVHLADFSVASLMSTFQQIDDLHARAQEQFGRSAQPFRKKIVNLFELITPGGKERFFSDGILTVNIPIDHHEFQIYRHTKVVRSFVRPVFSGSDASYRAVAIHQGQSVMRDIVGQQWMHIHQPVPAASERSPSGIIQADGEIVLPGGEYEGVSPFATWMLRIFTENQETRNSIKDIELVFDGFGRPVV